jgi:hypothetical protein
MEVAGKITYHFSVVSEFGSPGIVHTFIGHVPAQDIACIDEAVVGKSPALIHFQALFSGRYRPFGPDAGVVERFQVKSAAQGLKP